MKKVLFLFALLLVPLVAAGSDGPEAVVQFPLIAVVQPPTPPTPLQVTKLNGGQWYVITSNEPAFVIASPNDLVTITEDAGPVKLIGRFVDSDKIVTRVYKQKQVFLVEAKGRGQVELIVVLVGSKGVDPKLRKTLDVDDGVSPVPVPPGPKPTPPDPNPVPTVPPINIIGFHVLMIEDKQNQEKYTVGQERAMFGKVARDYLDQHCNKESNQPGYRIIDKTTDMSKAPKHWQDAAKARPSYPWLVVSDGKSGYDGPMPANFEDIQAILKKWGGN